MDFASSHSVPPPIAIRSAIPLPQAPEAPESPPHQENDARQRSDWDCGAAGGSSMSTKRSSRRTSSSTMAPVARAQTPTRPDSPRPDSAVQREDLLDLAANSPLPPGRTASPALSPPVRRKPVPSAAATPRRSSLVASPPLQEHHYTPSDYSPSLSSVYSRHSLADNSPEHPATRSSPIHFHRKRPIPQVVYEESPSQPLSHPDILYNDLSVVTFDPPDEADEDIMPLYASKPPDLTLPQRSPSDDTTTVPAKSPAAGKFSFFGWKSTSPAPSSSSGTSFSESIPSPLVPQGEIPPPIDIKKANSTAIVAPLASPFESEMEKELRSVSAELAASIRREMELEDIVERLQSEAGTNTTSTTGAPSAGRRTSDYFSDSGTSSVRFPLEDSKHDEMERLQRKADQEKALLRLDMLQKFNDERAKRKHAESLVHEMQQQSAKTSPENLAPAAAAARIRELEASLEDCRRRLGEERRAKEGFEDLVTALKSQGEYQVNERDNLRDEVVPQLQSTVEGLETEIGQLQELRYENTKLAQELQKARDENAVLLNSRRLEMDMRAQASKLVVANANEGDLPAPLSGRRRSPSQSQGASSAARSRSNSLLDPKTLASNDQREALAERLKDVEGQRDALHRALKSLLDRQDHQQAESNRRIKYAEAERDKAVQLAKKGDKLGARLGLGINNEVGGRQKLWRSPVISYRQKMDGLLA